MRVMKRTPVALTFQAESADFTDHDSRRIQQGEVGVDTRSMLTLLRSCVCAGFYHAPTRTGAISHVTGFRDEGGHCAAGALDAITRQFARRGLRIEDCSCFLVGGASSQRHVYDAVVGELRRRGIGFNELDVLGRVHRKLQFDPATGLVRLYRKPDHGEGLMTAGNDGRRFSDPRSRVATGASTLFRNTRLLELVREHVAPMAAAPGGRVHVWCAGCSVGMEVYSIAMVLLDALQRGGMQTPVKVLGSDVSADALEKAREGVYPRFAHTPPGHKPLLDCYTELAEGRRIRMGDALRRVVAFRERDILQGSRRHLFELVVCDHVFQYYPEDTQAGFLASLARAVRPGGYLYLSTPSNTILDSVTRSHPFECIERCFYKRSS
jgi:chemotaxis protein methyltransferase CheR